MSRVKRGVMTKKRHKSVLKRTKGFRAGRARVFSLAKQADMMAGQNAYRDRKLKKRDFRGLWSIRIGSALKPHGLNYSRFINTLFTKQVVVNRKMLAELAFQYPYAFSSVVSAVK